MSPLKPSVIKQRESFHFHKRNGTERNGTELRKYISSINIDVIYYVQHDQYF